MILCLPNRNDSTRFWIDVLPVTLHAVSNLMMERALKCKHLSYGFIYCGVCSAHRLYALQNAILAVLVYICMDERVHWSNWYPYQWQFLENTNLWMEFIMWQYVNLDAYGIIWFNWSSKNDWTISLHSAQSTHSTSQVDIECKKIGWHYKFRNL